MSLKKQSSDFLLSKKMTKNLFLDNKLSYLTDVIVPKKFREESKELSQLIESFLMHIQRVQDSINQDHRDWFNINEISDSDVLELYRKSYLQALEMSDSMDILVVKEILEVSKDLSQRKGTYFIFYLLTNILFYLIPEIKTQYDQLLEQLKDPNLSQSRRSSLMKQINDYKDANPANDLLRIVEEENCVYSVELNYNTNIFIQYLYPFLHPCGWVVNVGAKILLKFEDMFIKRTGFKIATIYRMTDLSTIRNSIMSNNLVAINPTDIKHLPSVEGLIDKNGMKYVDNGIIHPTNPTKQFDTYIKNQDGEDYIRYSKNIFTNVSLPFNFNEASFFNDWIVNTDDAYKIGSGNWKVGAGLVIQSNLDHEHLFVHSETMLEDINSI